MTRLDLAENVDVCVCVCVCDDVSVNAKNDEIIYEKGRCVRENPPVDEWIDESFASFAKKKLIIKDPRAALGVCPSSHFLLNFL